LKTLGIDTKEPKPDLERPIEAEREPEVESEHEPGLIDQELEPDEPVIRGLRFFKDLSKLLVKEPSAFVILDSQFQVHVESVAWVRAVPKNIRQRIIDIARTKARRSDPWSHSLDRWVVQGFNIIADDQTDWCLVAVDLPGDEKFRHSSMLSDTKPNLVGGWLIGL
jgi:hypothetical protein